MIRLLSIGRIIIASNKDDEKINLPGGLCRHYVHECKDKHYCDCCLVNNLCYLSVDMCNKNCVSTSDMVATTIPHYLPAPFPA
jgi:hypothetical protein